MPMVYQLSRYRILALMVSCLLVAAVLRLPDLSSAPPGLHFDEATNALLSADIGLNGARPIFTPGFTGQEPLFFYLAGGMMALIGKSVFALRLTSAFVGLLTIAATYWLGCEIFGDRRIAFVAAVLLTVSFWHVLFSRLGLRAISQPLLQTLAMVALFRGVRRHTWQWLVVGGIFLGLTAYTYLAARLFPIPLLLACAPMLANRYTARQRWGQLLLFGGVALVVVTPLLGYFVAHPEAFWVRVGQVAPSEGSLSLGESYVKSLGMFFLRGDPYWRFNLPERPLFDWFWGGLLVVGWLVCVWRLPKLTADWQRSAVWLLLLVPPIMLLATALATNEIVPSNLRAIGLIPFIFYLPAIGLFFLLNDLGAWFGWPVAWAGWLIGGLLLLVGGANSYQLYFGQWAVEPFVYYESDGDLAAAASFLEAQDLNDTSLYVAALHYQHPTMAFLSSHYDAIKWLPSSQAIVFPAAGSALYVYPHSSPAPQWAMRYLETAVSPPAPLAPDDQPAFAAYQLPVSPTLPLTNPVNINFGDAIRLVGYDFASTPANETMPITLYWRVTGVPAGDFRPFVHLEDGWGYRWSQADTFVYPVAQWATGDVIVQRVELPVLAGTPPLVYRLRVGLFDQGSGQRLAVLDENGRFAGDSFVLENVVVTAGTPPDPLPAPSVRLHQTARPGLQLLGYQRGATTVSTGELLGLSLWWHADQSQPYLNLRFELFRADRTGRILADTQPVYGMYPFNRWAAPQFIIDQQALRIPHNFPAGEYRLQLRLMDANDETLITADLGPLTIATTERLFTAPTPQTPLFATFGSEINLLGYDLTASDDPALFNLSLVWQAHNTPTADYTVFVHVLNPDGTCCLWQQDAMPRQNQYPTTRWLPGEVVVDDYGVVLPEETPPGDYPIEIGLYMAENGRRLQVVTPGQETGDVVYLRPLQIR